ncbi:MAG: GAF domain-containing protein [Anaerolineae bacterium]|nr:GAF domain-containing protein [Anaerolineae bacterium]
MDGLVLLLFALGFSMFGVVFMFARLRLERQAEMETLPETVVQVNLLDNDDAVLVAEGRGKLVYANARAQAWFGLSGGEPDLEILVESVQPSETFLELFSKEGSASFRIGARRVEASSHYVPHNGVPQMVVVMRELTSPNAEREILDPAHALILVGDVVQLLSSKLPLQEALDEVLRLIHDVIPFDVGEVNFWDAALQTLTPQGKYGDRAYFDALDAADGHYTLTDSCSGWLARYRQPLLVPDMRLRLDVRPKIASYGLQSLVGAPLLVGERLLGTIELASRSRIAFDHEDMALLQTLAGQIALAIENVRLQQTQSERAAELNGLQQIASVMTSMRDPRQMYTQLTSRIALLADVEMCGILLESPEQQALVGQPPFYGVPESIANMYRISLAEGSIGAVLYQTRDWWYSNAVLSDEIVREAGLTSLAEAVGVRTTALVQMRVGTRRFGVIQVANKRDGKGFTDNDMRLLSVFASQAAIVVENARLYDEERRRAEELSGLQQISRVIGMLRSADEMYSYLNEQIAKLMNCQICGVLLYEPSLGQLVSRPPFYGVDDDLVRHYRIAITPGTTFYRIYNESEYWISNELRTDPTLRDSGLDKLAMLIGVRQTLMVPLIINGRRIGVVQVANRLDGTEFTEEQARVLSIIASQAAVIIDNARLYREMRERTDESEGLRRIAELTASNLRLEEIISATVRETAAIFGCEICAVGMLDDQTGAIVIPPEYTVGLVGLQESIIIDTYRPGYQNSVALSQRPFLSNTLRTDPRLLPAYREIADRFGFNAAVQVPIAVQERSFGELTIASRSLREFTEDDLRLLQAIGVQLAAAVDRQKLYQATDADLRQRIREMDALTRISNEQNSTTEFERIITVIRNEVQRTLGVSFTSIVLFQSASQLGTPNALEVRKRYGHEKALAGLAPIERLAFERGEAIFVADYSAVSFAAVPETMRSAIAAPISYGGEIVGILHVATPEPERLSAQALDFVRAITNQVAISLGNEERYRDQLDRAELLKQRTDQLNQLFEIGRMVNSGAAIEDVLEAVAHAISDAIGFDVVIISVVDRRTQSTRRIAQSGLPLQQWEEARRGSVPLSRLEQLFKPEFQLSNSFFIPAEHPARRALDLSFAHVSPNASPRVGTQAWQPEDLLLVPLRSSGGTLIGVISVDEPRNGLRPNLRTIEALETFAYQAAFAIENYNLLRAYEAEAEATRRERDRLEQLYLATNEVQRAPDVPTRLSVIAESIRALGWGRVAVTLRDENLEPLETALAGFTPEDAQRFRRNLLPGAVWAQRLADPELRNYRVGGAYYLRYSDPWVTENKLMAGVVSSGDEAGTPTELSTLRLPTLTPRPSEQWHPLDTLYLPLYGLDRSRLIGIITLDSPVDGLAPTESALRPIELFSAQAAAALENARLYQDIRRAALQETRVNELMETVTSTLDLDEIIVGVASGFQQMIAFTRMNIALLNEDNTVFEVRRVTVTPRGEVRVNPAPSLPVENTALGFAVSEPVPKLYDLTDPEQVAGLDDLRAWRDLGERTALVVPMIAGGRTIGAIHMGSELREAFGFREQLDFVSRIANLTAVALENAQLLRQTIERERFSVALSRVGQSVSAMLSMQQILDTICTEALDIMSVDGVYIWLVEGEQQVGTVGRGPNADRFSGTRLSLSDSELPSTRAIQTRQPVVLSAHSPLDPPLYLAEALAEVPISALLCVPLLREQQAIGALAFIRTEGLRPFTGNDVEKANAFAIQASVVIQNAQLYQETLGLTSFNQAVIQSIQQGIIVVDQALTIRTVNAFMQRTFGWDAQAAVGQALFVYRPALEPILAASLAEVLQTGEPQSVPNVRLADTPRIGNYYLYPLQEGSSISGSVILVEDVTERTALEEDVARRAAQLATLTDISGQLTTVLETEALTRLVLEQLTRILEFDRATLWLRQANKLVIQAARGFGDDDALIGIEADIADSDLFREIASRGQVLNIPDIREDARFPMSLEQPTRSWLGVSLVSRGSLIGLLVLEKYDVAFYTPTMEQLALTYANQVAAAFENAQLFQSQRRVAAETESLYREAAARAYELEQQTKRLALLYRVSNALTQTLDLEDIFEVALRETQEMLGADHSIAYLFDLDEQVAKPIIEYPRNQQPPDLGGMLPFEQNPLVADVRRTLLPCAINNALHDAHVPVVPPSLAGQTIFSQMLVPLALGGQCIGMMVFSAVSQLITFRPEQVEVAQTIASQAAIAIQNANLLEQSFARTRELETLFEATQSISSTLDFEQVLRNIAMQMIVAVQADGCKISTWNPVSRYLKVEHEQLAVPNAATDAPDTHYDLAEYPTLERALKARQTILLRATDAHLSAAEHAMLAKRKAAYLIALPMVVREQAIGLILLEIHNPARTFSSPEVRLARTLAAQAAVAIENASLQTETAAKLQELFNLSQLSTALAATIEEEEVYEIVRQRFPDLVEAEVFLVAVVSPDRQQITYPVALRNGESLYLSPQTFTNDEVAFVMSSRSTQHLVGDEVASVLSAFASSLGFAQARAFIGVPLIASDQLLGALIVADSQEAHAFSLDDQRILETVGSQLATALQNARLFAQARRFAAELERAVQERTRELQRERDALNFLYSLTAELTSSLNIDVTLNRALVKLIGAVDADMGAILSIDSLSDTLTVRAQVNMPHREGEPTGYTRYEGLAGWVIQAQQPVVVADVQQDHRWLHLSEADNEPRAAIVALLEAGEEIQGVVMLFSRTPNHFSTDQLPSVVAAATQIANALNNADLYALIREQADRLGAMVRREQVDSTKNLAIVESIADGVMVANQDGDITQFNSAAERILGLPRQQVIGNHISALSGLYTAVGGQNWLEAVQRWTEDPASHQPGDELRAEITLESGKVISVILSPVRMGDQFLGTVSVFRDITREIEVDRMKTEFVATVSHELRTPMTSIKGYADLLLLGAAGPLNEAQARYLSTIKTNADKLSILVNELLDISRIDRGVVKLNLQAVNFEEVLQMTKRHLADRIRNERKEMIIETDVPPDLPLLRADFDKLAQIMTHLANNAFNYTRANGKITIRARAEGSSVVISVQDTGVGIPPEKQASVWNRFYRDEDERLVIETSGAGLGLPIVKEYVRLHEGEVWLESEVGVGSTFYVRIPAFSVEEESE